MASEPNISDDGIEPKQYLNSEFIVFTDGFYICIEILKSKNIIGSTTSKNPPSVALLLGQTMANLFIDFSETLHMEEKEDLLAENEIGISEVTDKTVKESQE